MTTETSFFLSSFVEKHFPHAYLTREKKPASTPKLYTTWVCSAVARDAPRRGSHAGSVHALTG